MADPTHHTNLWLLGDPPDGGRAGPNANGFVSGSPGLLERLSEWYPGDPTGPVQTLTLAATSVGFTCPIAANSATATIEVAPVRVVFDGQQATLTRGLLLPIGAIIQIQGKPSMNAAQFFTTAAGGLVQLAFWT